MARKVVIYEEADICPSDLGNNSTKPTISIYQYGERCGMCVENMSFPISGYHIETLPSGDLRINITMKFSNDSILFSTASNSAKHSSPNL